MTEDTEAAAPPRNRSDRRAAKAEQRKNPDLLNDAEAAAYIGMSESWLRNGRSQQRPNMPRYLKTSNRVRYRRADLDRWLASQVVEPGEVA